MGIRLRHLFFLACTVSMVAALGAVRAGAVSTSAADTEVAKAGLLVASDLPASWSQGPYDNSGSKGVAAAAAKIADCKSFVAFKKLTKGTPHAQSDEFTIGNSEFDNQVYVFPSDTTAEARMQQFASSGVPGCLDRLGKVEIEKSLASDKSTAGKVKNVVVDVQPNNIENYGDDTLSYEGSVKITMKDGTTLSLGLGDTAVRVGRAVSSYSYTIADQSVVDALDPAVQTSVARLRAAAGTES